MLLVLLGPNRFREVLRVVRLLVEAVVVEGVERLLLEVLARQESSGDVLSAHGVLPAWTRCRVVHIRHGLRSIGSQPEGRVAPNMPSLPQGHQVLRRSPLPLGFQALLLEEFVEWELRLLTTTEVVLLLAHIVLHIGSVLDCRTFEGRP